MKQEEFLKEYLWGEFLWLCADFHSVHVSFNHSILCNLKQLCLQPWGGNFWSVLFAWELFCGVDTFVALQQDLTCSKADDCTMNSITPQTTAGIYLHISLFCPLQVTSWHWGHSSLSACLTSGWKCSPTSRLTSSTWCQWEWSPSDAQVGFS